jgi:hypothetical protein
LRGLLALEKIPWRNGNEAQDLKNVMLGMDKGKYLPKATAKERQRIAYLTGILNKNAK